MYKISDLIGKEAITLNDAIKQGTISNVYFDTSLTRLKFFTILSDDDEGVRFTDFKNLAAFDLDAAIISSKSVISADDDSLSRYSVSPINLPAFNQNGKSLGIIRDIELDGVEVLRFITDIGQIESKTLISKSEDALVFNDTGKPLKIKKEEVVKPRDNAVKAEKTPVKKQDDILDDKQAVPNVAVNMQSSMRTQKQDDILDNKQAVPNVAVNMQGSMRTQKQDVGAINTQAIPRPVTPFEQKPMLVAQALEQSSNDNIRTIHTPLKIARDKTEVYRSPLDENSISARYAFLLGKRLQRSVYGKSGEIIAKENELISERTINIAKENGKLVALALHSL